MTKNEQLLKSTLEIIKAEVLGHFEDSQTEFPVEYSQAEMLDYIKNCPALNSDKMLEETMKALKETYQPMYDKLHQQADDIKKALSELDDRAEWITFLINGKEYRLDIWHVETTDIIDDALTEIKNLQNNN